MLEIGRAGQVILADGSDKEIRLTRNGGQAVFDSHARLFDAVSRGNCFICSTQSAVAFGTILTASAASLTLYNPSSSNKNLVLLEATATLVSGGTVGTIVYAVNDTPGQAIPTSTAALTIRNCLLGAGAASAAQAFSAATLPAAPVIIRTMFASPSTAQTALSPVVLVDNVDGKVILTPNTAITIQGIAIAGKGFLSIMWEEVVP